MPKKKKAEAAPLAKEDMIALLQQRLVAIQEIERHQEESEAHRLELEEKVCIALCTCCRNKIAVK